MPVSIEWVFPSYNFAILQNKGTHSICVWRLVKWRERIFINIQSLLIVIVCILCVHINCATWTNALKFHLHKNNAYWANTELRWADRVLSFVMWTQFQPIASQYISSTYVYVFICLYVIIDAKHLYQFAARKCKLIVLISKCLPTKLLYINQFWVNWFVCVEYT